jgi:AcrR family transcriptional regulator
MVLPPPRAEQTRVRILEAARAALLEGDGDFELADLARRAGTSIGLPYHRFGSKSGVIAQVVGEFYDDVWRAVNLADFPALDWGEREHERLRRLVSFLYSEPLSRLVISTLGRDPEVAALESARWAELIEAAARNLEKAQHRGQIANDIDPALTAALINGGIRHAIGLGLHARPRRPQEAMVQEIWSFVSRALQLAPPAGTSGPGAARRTDMRRGFGTRQGAPARRGRMKPRRE